MQAAGRIAVFPEGEEDFEGVLEIGVGEPSVDLKAVAYDAEGESDGVVQEFEWSLSASGIASGRCLSDDTSVYTLTANSAGTVTVYATAADGSGVRGEIQVRVIVPIRYFSLPSTARVEVEGETTLTPSFGPSDATYGELTDFAWESDNPEVATVEDGVVTGISEGTARITATSHNGLTSTCTVYVGVSARGVVITPQGVEGYEQGDVLEIALGQAAPNLKAVAYNDDGSMASSQVFDWSASAPGIAAGRYFGSDTSVCLLSALGEGEVTVYATCRYDSNLKGEIRVRVIVPLTAFSLPSALRLGVDGQTTLTPTLNPGNATYGALTDFAWESDNPEVATVEDGVVTAHTTGTARITATSYNGLTSTCTVTVIVMADRVVISPVGDETSVGAGDINLSETDYVLKAVAYDVDGNSDGVLQEFEWTASVDGIASGRYYDDSSVCNITPLSVGTVTIYATATDGSGVRGEFELSVVRKMTGLTLPESAEVAVGKTLTLTPTFTPTDATRKDLVWESSDDTIATVENGVVTPVGEPGEVIITATSVYYPELTASCTVKVGYAPTAIEVAPSDETAVYDENTVIVYLDRTLTLDSVFPDTEESEHLLGDLVWSIDSGSNLISLVANDDGSCTLTGRAVGTATITAASKHDTSVRTTLQVMVARPITSIALADCNYYYNDQQQFTLSLTVSPSNATFRNYEDFLWMSSDESVVTVENGVCTIQGTGVSYVSVQSRYDANVVTGCTVRISKMAASIGIIALDDDFNPVEIDGQATIAVDSYLQLYAVAFEEGYDIESGEDPGAHQVFNWSSSNPNVVAIHGDQGVFNVTDANSPYCLVHALRTGSATITANSTDGSGVRGTFTVYVVDPMEGVDNVPSEISLYVGDTYTFEPQPLPADYANFQGFVWHDVKERDQRVLTMEGDTVKAVGPGKVTVTVYPLRNEMVSASCTVTVYQYVESIKLEGGKDTMTVGETLTLTATALGGDGSTDFIAEPGVTWTTSDPRVATVRNDGVVEAVGSGEVTITAISRENPEVNESITIQVSPAQNP